MHPGVFCGWSMTTPTQLHDFRACCRILQHARVQLSEIFYDLPDSLELFFRQGSLTRITADKALL